MAGEDHGAAHLKGIRSANVTAWLEAHVDGLKPPFAFSLIEGGHSNLTYCVEDASGRKLS